MAVVAAGVVGFVLLGDDVSWLDAVYMVVISVTGVGYEEVVHTGHNPALRIFNIAILVVGVATMISVLSFATAFVVEGELTNIFRRRRMERRIAALSGHVVVCGAGDTGALVIRELGKTGAHVVAVDLLEERLAALPEAPWLATETGDATDGEVLERAGVGRAASLVAALPSDKDNLVITVTARQRRPDLRIVARHRDLPMGDRIRKAGADASVSPTAIGAMRLASEIVRPNVVSFLDVMLRDPTGTLRIEELRVPKGSRWSGKPLSGIDLRGRFGLVCLALRYPSEASFHYGPADEQVIGEEAVLVVMGDVERVRAARDAALTGS